MDFFQGSRFMSVDIVEAFQGMYCQHKPVEHGEGRGKAFERMGFATQPLCDLVAKTIYPTMGQVLVPALPFVLMKSPPEGIGDTACHSIVRPR